MRATHVGVRPLTGFLVYIPSDILTRAMTEGTIMRER